MASQDGNDQSVEDEIRSYKQQAIQYQKEGKLEQAKQALSQARNLEFSYKSSVDDWEDSTKLQQLAIYLKNQGDIEGAKQALLKSKQLKAQQQQQQQQQHVHDNTPTDTDQISTQRKIIQETEASGAGVDLPPDTTATREDEAKSLPETNGRPNSQEPVEPVGSSSQDSTNTTKEDCDEDDELAELLGTDDDGDPVLETTTFTDAEMMDLDMMIEFQLGGFPVPTLEEYQNKIADCKTQALALKEAGKTRQALDALRKMKQFQAVHDGLAQSTNVLRSNDDDHQWLEELNKEDNELIRELFTGSSGPVVSTDDGVVANGATLLELDDLEDMDPETLKDAMQLGMQLPRVEDVQAKADVRKADAVRLKREGNLAGAKAALVDFKTLSQQVLELQALHKLLAQQVSTEQIGDGTNGGPLTIDGKDIRDEDLEALLASEGESPKKAAAEAPAALPKPKTSEELKQEAIRLRDAKKTAEATQILKLYKQALAREAKERDLAQRKESLEKLAKEVKFAQEQQLKFRIFYQPLVDTEQAIQQIHSWTQYAENCQKVATLIETKGSKAVSMERGTKSHLLVFPVDDFADIAESAINPDEDRLEVSLLGVSELQNNKVWQKLAKTNTIFDKIQVHISIHLPVSESEAEKPINLWFESSQLVKEDGDEGYATFSFGSPIQYVNIPRGDTKFAKTFLRRMERRKIQISVYPVTSDEKAAKKGSTSSWLFRGGKKEADVEPVDTETATSFGKITLETKSLLQQRCIVGDFPLVGAGKREVGGNIQVCLRTGVPFVNEGQGDDGLSTVNLPSYEQALSFLLSKEN